MMVMRMSSCLGWLSAVLSIVGLVANPASAQLARAGDEFRINTYTSGNQFSSQVAGLPDGGFVVVWTSDQQDGDAGGIFAKRFDVSGQAVSSEIAVNSTTVGSQVAPKVAVSPNDAFLVVWATFADTEVAPSVEARLFDDEAAPTADQFTVSDSSFPDVFSPNATANDAGQFVVVWGFNAGGQYLIRGQLLDSDAQFIRGPFGVSDGSTDRDHLYPAIAAGPDSSFMVVWYADFGSAVGGRTFGAPDEPSSSERRIDSDAIKDRTIPQICAYEDGDFAVVWDGYRTPAASSGEFAKYRRFRNSGSPATDQILVADDVPDQGSPSVACRGAAQTAVVWDEPAGVRGRFFPEGPPFEFGEFHIASTADHSRFRPSVAMLGTEHFVVTWTECRLTDCDISGQRFTLLGATDCPGDCNRNTIVTVDELIVAVNLALGSDQVSMNSCLSADTDLDYSVSVDEILKAVDRSLRGCT